MILGDLSDAYAGTAVFHDPREVSLQRGTSDAPAFAARSSESGAHPLDDQVAFQFGDRADDDHDGFPEWAAGIKLAICRFRRRISRRLLIRRRRLGYRWS